MKKRALTLGLMVALSVSVVSGCGQKASGTSAETTAAETAAGTEAAGETAGGETAAATEAAEGAETAAKTEGEYQFISPTDAVKAAKDKSAHVLDVREWSNYAEGRVADSEWCPIFPLDDDALVESMKSYAEANLSDGQKIYIICNSGQKGAQKATGVLQDAGIDSSLIYTVEGGAKALASEKDALTSNRADENIEWKSISAADALKAVGSSDVQILDVRDDAVYAEGHLEGSLQTDLKDFENPKALTAMYELAAEMDKSKPVYLLCYSGNKCAKAGISVLKDAGFDVDNLFIIENGAKDKDIQAAFVK